MVAAVMPVDACQPDFDTPLGERPDAWIDQRKRSIGGSDAAVVLGVSPWKGPFALWAEKTGRAYPNSAGRNRLRLRAGNYCEPLIRDEYQRITGLEVRPGAAFAYHPSHPFLSANTDGLVMLDSSPVVWEAKTASPQSFAKQWRAGPPLHYVIQCQHYMAVLGLDAAQICVLIGLDKIRIFDVPRHDAFIDEALLPAEIRFWELVTSDTPPTPDGSRESFSALSRYVGPPRAGTTAELDRDVDQLAHKLHALDQLADESAKARRECKARLLAALSDHEYGETNGYRIRRKKHGTGYTIKVEPKE